MSIVNRDRQTVSMCLVSVIFDVKPITRFRTGKFISPAFIFIE